MVGQRRPDALYDDDDALVAFSLDRADVWKNSFRIAMGGSDRPGGGSFVRARRASVGRGRESRERDPMSEKIFLSGLSVGKDWKAEISKIASRIKSDLAGKSCDLVIFFVSEVHKDFDAPFFSRSLAGALSCRILIG